MASGSPISGVLRRLTENERVKEQLQPRADVSDWETLVDGAWYQFTWTTPTQSIRMTLRDGDDRFLLLAEEQAFVPAFLEVTGLANRVRRPRLMVSDFVKDSLPPVNSKDVTFARQYRISGVFAEAFGYGRSLQTVALWGDDLLSAELFTTLLRQIEPYRVTVREMVGHADIASVGSKGEVNFFYGATAHLKKVDTFFRHLKRKHYIRWGSQFEEDSDVDFDDRAS